MKVVLVGPRSDRDRIRPELQGSVDIVAEHDALAEARRQHTSADAFVLTMAASSGEQGDQVETLTAREIQVLELMAEGLPNKAIAARLGISDQTVKFHVAAVAGKLAATNRTDAVRRAVRRGLITL
jgi:DNA-binding NarL/FixJ family response regulator